MIRRDDLSLGEALQRLSANQGTPVGQDAELTGLLSRVEETDDIPESLVVVLSRVLEFLYREETRADGKSAAGD
ncbi:MAG: hypothetical protein HKN19_14225 [Halioglobus sp.]|nr:hypothetical protein [Halioglobus sp.]